MFKKEPLSCLLTAKLSKTCPRYSIDIDLHGSPAKSHSNTWVVSPRCNSIPHSKWLGNEVLVYVLHWRRWCTSTRILHWLCYANLPHWLHIPPSKQPLEKSSPMTLRHFAFGYSIVWCHRVVTVVWVRGGVEVPDLVYGVAEYGIAVGSSDLWWVEPTVLEAVASVEFEQVLGDDIPLILPETPPSPAGEVEPRLLDGAQLCQIAAHLLFG